MKQAGAAMKQIHGGMSLEQVDETMYVIRYWLSYHIYTTPIHGLEPLTRRQGQTPRTTPAQRGNRTGDYQCSAGRTAGRGGAGCRVGGIGAGGYGRADAQYGSYTCWYPVGPVTGSWELGT